MLSLTAKTSALCGEHSADGVVLETISYIETLTTELSNKIWQKISLLPRLRLGGYARAASTSSMERATRCRC